MKTPLSSSATPRIAYIDLLKGVCIILIVTMHCELMIGENVPPWLTPLRVVPLYFFLSGLFFKTYGSAKEFVLRKIETLIVPYIFFQVLLAVAVLVRLAASGTLADCSTERLVRIILVVNGPLWFLRCLFLMSLFYYPLARFVRSKVAIGVITVAVAGAVWWCTQSGYLTPAYIRAPWNFIVIHFLRLPQALLALPLFFAGSMCRKLLDAPRRRQPEIGIGVLAVLLLLLTAHRMNMYESFYEGSFAEFYAAALAYIVFWIILCRMVASLRLSALTYLGRYSLIVLGMHLPMIMIFQTMVQNKLLILLLTVLSQFPLIEAIRRLFPHLTAQKPIFRKD